MITTTVQLQYWDRWLQAELGVSRAGSAQCEIKHLFPAYLVCLCVYLCEHIIMRSLWQLMAANRRVHPVACREQRYGRASDVSLETSQGQRDKQTDILSSDIYHILSLCVFPTNHALFARQNKICIVFTFVQCIAIKYMSVLRDKYE